MEERGSGIAFGVYVCVCGHVRLETSIIGAQGSSIPSQLFDSGSRSPHAVAFTSAQRTPPPFTLRRFFFCLFIHLTGQFMVCATVLPDHRAVRLYRINDLEEGPRKTTFFKVYFRLYPAGDVVLIFVLL